MILPETYSAALLLMLVSMICWGSWANTFKLAGKWRFELFYYDYSLGVLIAATIYALTFGNLGYDGFTFIDDLMHAGKRQIFFGVVGGVVLGAEAAGSVTVCASTSAAAVCARSAVVLVNGTGFQRCAVWLQ